MAASDEAVNNQLVRALIILHRLHNAEFVPEDVFTYYHIIQEQSGKGGIGPALPALGHALAGSLATAGAKALVYPIELCITRLQVQRQLRGNNEAESAAKNAEKEYSSLLDAAQKIYKTEGGLKAFYTGCASDVGKGIIDSFLFFLVYNFIRQYEQKKAGVKHLSVMKELGVGVAAGSVAKFFTTPIQNIVTRQQTAALVAARDPSSSTSPGESDQLSIKDIALQIRSERGIAGFWAGYSESVILTLNPALTFAVDSTLRRLLPKAKRESPSPQLTFLIAALSKAVATALTYPAMLAKSRAQAASPKSNGPEGDDDWTSEPSEKSTLSTAQQKRKQVTRTMLSVFRSHYNLLLALRKIYRDEGASGLYSGLEGEVLKGFLQHGLTMMMKENVHGGVIQMYYMLLKATKSWPEEFGKVKDGVEEGVKNVVNGVGGKRD